MLHTADAIPPTKAALEQHTKRAIVTRRMGWTNFTVTLLWLKEGFYGALQVRKGSI